MSWLLEGKLCAPGGGRAAGSALHELGELGSVTFPVEAKVKIQNSLHGKGAQACQSGCSDRVLASEWVRFWRASRARAKCTLLVGTAGRTSDGVALQVPAGSAQRKDTPVPGSDPQRGQLDTRDSRAGSWTLEGFYFYLNSPLLPSLSPAVQLCCSVLGLRSFLSASPWQAWERFPFFSGLGTFP